MNMSQLRVICHKSNQLQMIIMAMVFLGGQEISIIDLYTVEYLHLGPIFVIMMTAFKHSII